MRPGIKIKEILEGTGEEAVKSKTVLVNVRYFLNHGAEIPNELMGGPRVLIDLKRRECIAGLRYGIEGMRVGGRRKITISPHLTYGPEGLFGHIPPNAVLICEVELIEVREQGVRRPEDYPPGKHLHVFHPGEATRNQPRWQFDLDENGRCGITVTHPLAGMAWRHAPSSFKEVAVDAATAQTLFEHAAELKNLFPKDCLAHEDLWSDTEERGNGITRDKANNELCLTIGVMERGEWLIYFSVAETSPAAVESLLLRRIRALLE